LDDRCLHHHWYRGHSADFFIRISTDRQAYNDMVLMCNNLYQTFPSNVVARVFGYGTEEYFEVKATEEREAPKVSL
jgi:LemA protein